MTPTVKIRKRRQIIGPSGKVSSRRKDDGKNGQRGLLNESFLFLGRRVSNDGVKLEYRLGESTRKYCKIEIGEK